jgi:hypothetical protein
MAVVDARAEGISVGSLFRSLRLVQLNSILCSDLSERECAYNSGTIDETDPEKVQIFWNFLKLLICHCDNVAHTGSTGAAV